MALCDPAFNLWKYADMKKLAYSSSIELCNPYSRADVYSTAPLNSSESAKSCSLLVGKNAWFESMILPINKCMKIAKLTQLKD